MDIKKIPSKIGPIFGQKLPFFGQKLAFFFGHKVAFFWSKN